MKSFFKLLFLLVISLSIQAQPFITSFSPASGSVGTTVIITGSGFSSVAASNTVMFGAVKATVNSSTATTISVTVPVGATYKPLSVSTGGLTAYSTLPFDVTFTGGTSTFQPSSYSFGVKLQPGHVPGVKEYADLDGDGKPELIVATQSSSQANATLSIYTNISSSGNISFASKLDISVNHNIRGLAIGDLNGDGKLDLAVTGFDSGTVSVLKNTSFTGLVSFDIPVTLRVTFFAQDVVINDVDGDGKPDILVANANDFYSITSVFRNTGTSGTLLFAPKIDFQSGMGGTGSIAVRDLDGDRKPELIVGLFDTDTISVFRNLSTAGNISFASRLRFSSGDHSDYLAAGDFDGDGKIDIVVSNYFRKTLSLFRNTSLTGAISFAPYTDIAGYGSFAIDDLNGDGLPEIITGYDTVWVYKNTGTIGTISFQTKSKIVAGTYLTSADLNGDGRTDLTFSQGDSVKIYTYGPCTPPVAHISNSPGGNTFCQGTTLTLIADSAAGQTFQWQLNGANISGAVYARFPASASGNYSVVVTATGCMSTSNPFTTIMYPKPKAAFSVNSSSQCVNTNNFIFTDSSSIFSGTISRKWNFGNGLTDTSTQINPQKKYTAANSYNVYLLVKSNFSCSDSIFKTMTVNPQPSVGAITGLKSKTAYDTGMYSVALQSGMTYNWSVTGATIAMGQGTNSIIVNWSSGVTGLVKVVGTSLTSCSDSSSLNVSVSFNAIEELNQGAVILFPNPAREVLSITNTKKGLKGSTIQVYDVLGRMVMENFIADDVRQYNLIVKDMKFGTYFLCVKSPEYYMNARFIKE